MPVLLKIKYEMVARNIVRGMSQREACHAAGYESKSRAAAHRIANRPEVKARVMELKTEGEHEALLREKTRAQAGKDVRARHTVSKEYLLNELQEQLALARAGGNVVSGITCIKLMALITGTLKVVKPAADTKTKKRKSQEAVTEQEKEDGNDDRYSDPVDDRARPIQALDRILSRLDDLSGDDAEEEADPAQEGGSTPDGADGDGGARGAAARPGENEGAAGN